MNLILFLDKFSHGEKEEKVAIKGRRVTMKLLTKEGKRPDMLHEIT